MEHRHVERGTCWMGSNKYYTIKGKLDVDLEDLRSLAMGKGEVPAGDPIQRLKSGSGWGPASR